MNRFKHWSAATVFIGVMAVIGVGAVACFIYALYLIVTEFPSFVLIMSACVLFVGGTYWAENYINAHGWPWKPKHQSESGEAK